MFRHKRKKLAQVKKSGSSPNKGKWFVYELLSFLFDVDVLRKITSTSSDRKDSDVYFI